MTYNPPQYALTHLASLKVGDKAVLLEPVKLDNARTSRGKTSYGVSHLILEDPFTVAKWAHHQHFKAESGDYITLDFIIPFPNGVKVKVLSVEPVRCHDIVLQCLDMMAGAVQKGPYYVDSGSSTFDSFYPGAWERNNWFWVAAVEVVE